MEKCIGCELCAGVCPAKCIYVRGADNDPDDPTSPGERFGFVYEINYLRCIHCDLCVEACPTEAITESQAVRVLASPTAATRSTPRPSCSSTTTASPQHLPWEDWREGEDAARRAAGCGPPRRPATPTSSARSAGAASSATASAPRRTRRRERSHGGDAGRDRPIGDRRSERPDGASVMELIVFVVASAMVLGGALGVVVLPPPGARRAQPRADAVRRRRALRGAWRPTSSPPCR